MHATSLSFFYFTFFLFSPLRTNVYPFKALFISDMFLIESSFHVIVSPGRGNPGSARQVQIVLN